MKTILGLDIGYGHVKCVLSTSDGAIQKIFKFPSSIGITAHNEFVSDSRIIDYKEHSYYVGEDALNLPSDNHVDITEYKNLEYYAPVFLYKVLKMIETIPDVIVTGLSKAQIQNSGYFKDALSKFDVNSEHFEFNSVYILPQGAGSKLAIDKYGYDFPNVQTEFTGASNFIGCDIGFKTLDLFRVTDGKTSPSVFEGIENQGIMKIATMLATKIKDGFDRQISLHEAQEILDSGIYKLRGQKHDMADAILEIKKVYIKELIELIENRYGKILDKCDFIFLTGGGSAFFNTTENGFIRVPKSHYEYYNAIGFALWGQKNAK